MRRLLTCFASQINLNYVENYVLWLREQCALADVDLGEITRINAHAHKGISTRGVRVKYFGYFFHQGLYTELLPCQTMIVYMQKTLHDDHKDTLHEEYNASIHPNYIRACIASYNVGPTVSTFTWAGVGSGSEPRDRTPFVIRVT